MKIDRRSFIIALLGGAISLGTSNIACAPKNRMFTPKDTNYQNEPDDKDPSDPIQTCDYAVSDIFDRYEADELEGLANVVLNDSKQTLGYVFKTEKKWSPDAFLTDYEGEVCDIGAGMDSDLESAILDNTCAQTPQEASAVRQEIVTYFLGGGNGADAFVPNSREFNGQPNAFYSMTIGDYSVFCVVGEENGKAVAYVREDMHNTNQELDTCSNTGI